MITPFASDLDTVQLWPYQASYPVTSSKLKVGKVYIYPLDNSTVWQGWMFGNQGHIHCFRSVMGSEDHTSDINQKNINIPTIHYLLTLWIPIVTRGIQVAPGCERVTCPMLASLPFSDERARNCAVNYIRVSKQEVGIVMLPNSPARYIVYPLSETVQAKKWNVSTGFLGIRLMLPCAEAAPVAVGFGTSPVGFAAGHCFPIYSCIGTGS